MEKQPDKVHLPNPGVRVARVCSRPDCNYREFNAPDWVCPEHGQAKVQENHSYLGLSTV